jgi:hypothetical protein
VGQPDGIWGEISCVSSGSGVSHGVGACPGSCARPQGVKPIMVGGGPWSLSSESADPGAGLRQARPIRMSFSESSGPWTLQHLGSSAAFRCPSCLRSLPNATPTRRSSTGSGSWPPPAGGVDHHDPLGLGHPFHHHRLGKEVEAEASGNLDLEGPPRLSPSWRQSQGTSLEYKVLSHARSRPPPTRPGVRCQAQPSFCATCMAYPTTGSWPHLDQVPTWPRERRDQGARLTAGRQAQVRTAPRSDEGPPHHPRALSSCEGLATEGAVLHPGSTTCPAHDRSRLGVSGAPETQHDESCRRPPRPTA